jgi:hypothetical protein
MRGEKKRFNNVFQQVSIISTWYLPTRFVSQDLSTPTDFADT